jgi:hypothetical protein
MCVTCAPGARRPRGRRRAGAESLERRCRLLQVLAGALDSAREETGPDLAPPSLTGEGLVGAVLSVIHSRLLDGRGGSPLELAAPLMSMIAHPYLGADAA